MCKQGEEYDGQRTSMKCSNKWGELIVNCLFLPVTIEVALQCLQMCKPFLVANLQHISICQHRTCQHLSTYYMSACVNFLLPLMYCKKLCTSKSRCKSCERVYSHCPWQLLLSSNCHNIHSICHCWFALWYIKRTSCLLKNCLTSCFGHVCAYIVK